MAEGWIKFHRKITDWEWYTDYPVFRLFTHILLTANREPSRYRGHDIPIGSKVCGIHALSEQTGLSVKQVRTALDKLGRTGEVAIKANNKFSVITITSWSDYQGEGKRAANKGQTSGKQRATSKEVENVRSEEYIPENLFHEFWQMFPKQRAGSKDKAHTAYQKAMERDTEQSILDGCREYARSDEVAKGYAKGAAAWLNDDRWNNDYKNPQREKKHGAGRITL